MKDLRDYCYVLGILLIDSLKQIVLDNVEVAFIVNKYLPNTEGRKGLMKCKAELVDAGFNEYAQL
jgi:hypothetical protein